MSDPIKSDLLRKPDGTLQDEIIITLPDGRFIHGHAIIIGDPVDVKGGGHIRQDFTLDQRYSGKVCVMLVELTEDFNRGRIVI